MNKTTSLSKNSNIQIWDAYWKKQGDNPDTDDAMSLFLSLHMLAKCEPFIGSQPSSFLEMGAGSGRSSRYLNILGSKTGILDISETALDFCKTTNTNVPNQVEYYLEDLFRVKENSSIPNYSVTWNSGVMEHFSKEEQTKIFVQMMSKTSDQGLCAVYTPYAKSFFYRVGKFILESLKKFPFGQEVPVKTLSDVVPKNYQLAIKEKDCGFVILIFNGFKAIGFLPFIGKAGTWLHHKMNKFFVKLLRNKTGRNLVFIIDSILSFIFGGYLLLTIIKRK